MRKKKRKKNLWRIILILFFGILIFAGTSIISSRNRLVDINIKDVEYVEIIANKNDVMQTIKNSREIKDIIVILNRLRGKISNRDSSADVINYINVYLNSVKKIEFVKSGQILRVDNKWYVLNRRNSDLLEKIIKKYELNK